MQDLQNQVEGLKQKALPQLAGQNKLIDDLLSQLKSKSTPSLPGTAGNALDSFKNILGH